MVVLVLVKDVECVVNPRHEGKQLSRDAGLSIFNKGRE